MAQIQSKEFKTKNGHTVVIRSATRADAQAIIDLERSVMAEQIYTLTTTEELNFAVEQEGGWIQGHIDNPSNLLLVAELNSNVIGIIDFKVGHRKRIAHTGEFGMSVIKEHRADGIGMALLKSLIEWAECHPVIEKVCLKVHATNKRAIGLYRKLGFKEEGRAVHDLKYEAGEYVDSLLMGRFVK